MTCETTTVPETRAAANAVPEPACSGELTWRAGDKSAVYTARAGHLDVIDAAGELEGKMFNIAYIASSVNGAAVDQRERPVSFCFNGGPGSASVPINFGGIGPKRVVPNGCGFVDAAHYEVEDNPGTLLPESDLVFLDALGTGWSFVAEGYGTERVYGLEEDARTFCRAICAWLEENGRWNSPVYLVGESYGTMRNSVLMRYLGEAGVPVAGVVMISALFDWTQNLPGNDMYFVGMMPSFAATAQYFGLVGEGVDENEWFDRASEFASCEYAPALLLGDRISEDRARAVAEKLSAFIGLPVEYLLQRNCRVSLEEFRRDLLADRGLVTGRLDMRFAGTAPLSIQNASFYFACDDPASHAIESAWYAAFRAFLHDEVGYRGPAGYRLSVWGEIGIGWRWVHDEPGVDETTVAAPNVALDIAVALRRSPTTKLMIMGGRFDAATPWWNVEHTIAQLYLPRELRDKIVWCRYGCGHMCYVDEPTLEQMTRDLEAFYRA